MMFMAQAVFLSEQGHTDRQTDPHTDKLTDTAHHPIHTLALPSVG